LSGNGIAGTNGGGTSDAEGGLDGSADGSASCDDEEPQPTSKTSAASEAISGRNLGEWRTPAR
jgi:hypothetical protein